jgi:hypothetical protein
MKNAVDKGAFTAELVDWKNAADKVAFNAELVEWKMQLTKEPLLQNL